MQMQTKLRFYLIFIASLSLAILPLLDWSTVVALQDDTLVGAITLLGVCVLSEVMAVKYRVGQQQPSSSIAFLPYFASAILFGPTIAILTGMVTTACSQALVRKRPFLYTAFNTSQVGIALSAACAIYVLAGGAFGDEPAQTLLSLRGIVAFGALAVTFFLVNQLLVSVALALSGGERIAVTFRRVAGGSGANFVYDIIVSPIAVVLALLYSYFAVGGLLMIILPLLIIRHSYATNLKLLQANKDLLTVLVKTIETRDPYTSGHSIRVSILAKAIAEDMDLSANKVDNIEMTALVHDIGKVDAIYASIIRKEGGLTEAERHIIVTHAAKGAEFLKTLASFNNDLIDGVRHHHERFDGTGYPDGLKGEAIPLEARIIQLCDSIDAMLSDRPYRKALSVDHVRGELVRCAGAQFDPRIVDIILRRNTLERAAALVRPENAAPQLVVASA